MLANCQNSGVLDKYREFYILFPTTGQCQRYGHKNVLLSLSCYLKSKKEVVPGSYLYSVLNARGEEMK